MARRLLAEGFEVGDRIGIWAPNCVEWAVVQYATAKIGVILVNINPAIARTSSSTRCASRAAEGWSPPPSSRAATTWRWWPRCGRRCPVCSSCGTSATTPGTTGSPTTSRRRSRRCARGWRRCRRATRSTSSTRAAPPASRRARRSSHRNILNNGFFVGEACGYTEHDRVCIPVPLYHCFGMVLGNLGCTTARRDDGLSGGRVRCAGDAAGRGARTVHVAVRRADDVHRRARPPDGSPTSTCPRCAPGSWPAHRARSR